MTTGTSSGPGRTEQFGQQGDLPGPRRRLGDLPGDTGERCQQHAAIVQRPDRASAPPGGPYRPSDAPAGRTGRPLPGGPYRKSPGASPRSPTPYPVIGRTAILRSRGGTASVTGATADDGGDQADPGPVPAARSDRPRWHGRGVAGPGRIAGPARRGQVPQAAGTPAGPLGSPGSPGSVSAARPGSPRRSSTAESRSSTTSASTKASCISSWSCSKDATSASCSRTTNAASAPGRGGRRHRRAGRGRSRLHPRTGHRPPGPQARQHHAAHRRHGEDLRLRHRQARP